MVVRLLDQDLDDLSHEDQSATIFDYLSNRTDWKMVSVRAAIFRGVRLLPYMITQMVPPLIIRQIFLLLEQRDVPFD